MTWDLHERQPFELFRGWNKVGDQYLTIMVYHLRSGVDCLPGEMLVGSNND